MSKLTTFPAVGTMEYADEMRKLVDFEDGTVQTVAEYLQDLQAEQENPNRAQFMSERIDWKEIEAARREAGLPTKDTESTP